MDTLKLLDLNTTKCYKYVESPLGRIMLLASDKGLSGIWFQGQRYYPIIKPHWKLQDNELLLKVEQALKEYFKGKISKTTFEFDFEGSEFQKQVWKELLNIKYGETSSYGQVAKRIGQPTAYRAVATAIGKNPITILIPCHRVLNSKGELAGYAGGLDRKAYLLKIQKS